MIRLAHPIYLLLGGLLLLPLLVQPRRAWNSSGLSLLYGAQRSSPAAWLSAGVTTAALLLLLALAGPQSLVLALVLKSTWIEV